MSVSIAPYCRRINYYETDKMAIVHHSNYVRFMEEARLDYMARAGMHYADLEAQGIIMPVVSVECRYHLSLVFGDEMKIVTKLTTFNGVRAAYTYEIYRAKDDALAVFAKSEHCFLDETTRRPVSLKKVLPEAYDVWMRLFDQVQEVI